ncbi:unnamed protein product [Miscanthus lutarioriparius]|uniref:Uncharacterized protein n=1 Tax=Miscanthus lutarioriparius TaxID=422564 RepID=A0A811RN65_9POAL|nr:unnamed protein product [Miscanthus lutarioriparius]
MEGLTSSEIAGFVVGALLLGATIAAPKVDGFIASSQRRSLGMCKRCGDLRIVACSQCKGTGSARNGRILNLGMLDDLYESLGAEAKTDNLVPCTKCRVWLRLIQEMENNRIRKMKQLGNFNLPDFFNYLLHDLYPAKQKKFSFQHLFLKVNENNEIDKVLKASLQFLVKENRLGSTMPVEDIRSGFDTRGTELEGIDSTVLMRALRWLEQQGKAAIFKVNDSGGVKFM